MVGTCGSGVLLLPFPPERRCHVALRTKVQNSLQTFLTPKYSRVPRFVRFVGTTHPKMNHGEIEVLFLVIDGNVITPTTKTVPRI